MAVNKDRQEHFLSSSVGFNLPSLLNFLKQVYVLIKPGVISLVIFTALCAMLVAPSEKSIFIKGVSLLLIAMGASGSAILNMWHDRIIDSKMDRTKFRPIPAGNISANTALAIGLVFSSFSVVALFFFANIQAAILLAFTILYYSVFYTMFLKYRTAQNIVIGGLAGALPPVIAWISISNEMILYPMILCLIIFLWTPPHSWALAIYRKDEYAKESIPMLPVTHGVAFTKLQIVLYTIILFIVSILPYIVLMSGGIYLISAVILSSMFMYYSIRLYFSSDDEIAMKTFNFSIYYIFLIFVALLCDHYLIQ